MPAMYTTRSGRRGRTFESCRPDCKHCGMVREPETARSRQRLGHLIRLACLSVSILSTMYPMSSSTAMSPTEIKDIRIILGWTQERLAVACGVEKAAVSHWENGIRQPSGSAEILLTHCRDMALRLQQKNS